GVLLDKLLHVSFPTPHLLRSSPDLRSVQRHRAARGLILLTTPKSTYFIRLKYRVKIHNTAVTKKPKIPRHVKSQTIITDAVYRILMGRSSCDKCLVLSDFVRKIPNRIAHARDIVQPSRDRNHIRNSVDG